MTVNSTSSFLGIKAVSEVMKKAEKGSIVNTSSIAGIVGGKNRRMGLQYDCNNDRLVTAKRIISANNHQSHRNSTHSV